jgi:hypothetical protein
MVVSLMSCDKIKDATSKDFTVKGVSFDFSAESKAGTATKSAEAVAVRAATDQSFTVTRAVNISELGSNDVIEYANKINAVKANNALIKVTAVPVGDYTVENLTVTAVGVAGSLFFQQPFTLGGDITLPANANTYMEAFIMKLVDNGSVSVTVTGKTDAPAGTTINICYESDLLFTASIF